MQNLAHFRICKDASSFFVSFHSAIFSTILQLKFIRNYWTRQFSMNEYAYKTYVSICICIYIVCLPDRCEFIDHQFGSRLSCWLSLYELPKKMSKNPSTQRRRLWMVALPLPQSLSLPQSLALLLDDLLKIPFKICLLTLRTTQQTLTCTHTHARTPTTVRSAVKKFKIKIEQSKMCLCLGSSKQNKTKWRGEMRHKQREDVAICEWWTHYQHLGKPNKSQ